MATNQARWVGNLNGATEPLIMRALFQAGSTQAIKIGELLEFTGDTNTAFVPIDSDYDYGSAHDLAIANEEIKAGDLAGYYEVIVPRPGDLFIYSKATAGTDAIGTAMYFSSSEAVTTSGSNIIGHIASMDHYPNKMGHLADGDIYNPGVTVKSTSNAIMTIEESNSYYARLQAG